ncbi:MAG: hypothetical protein PHQ43_06665 [Dehalococcoidales bacterium]|nr:hypothetical protein [Dehalococcoidales bacterium]
MADDKLAQKVAEARKNMFGNPHLSGGKAGKTVILVKGSAQIKTDSGNFVVKKVE